PTRAPETCGDRSWRTSLTALIHELPELPLADDFHNVPAGGQAANLHELGAAARAGDLQLVRTPAHEHVGEASRLGLNRGACLARRGDRLAARPAQEAGEGYALPGERRNAAELRRGPGVPQCRDELPGGLVPPAARAQTAVDHFF